jgi:hypothetical protein
MQVAGAILFMLTGVVTVVSVATGQFEWALLRDVGLFYVLVMVAIILQAAVKQRRRAQDDDGK